MEKNVCIVNFNTTELTTAAIRSLLKCTPDCIVTVFDNSDKTPFPQMPGVNVIDNTRGQIIDFDMFLSQYPHRMKTTNNWASAKHCYTIDCLFSLFPDGFVIMDSDVLVKKDISSFFDNDVVFVGKIRGRESHKNRRIARLLPFLCWINVPECMKHGIRYFDGARNWKLSKTNPDEWYDTGASFLEDCTVSGLPVRCIDIDDFIIHLYGGSHKNKYWRIWLDEHRSLFE